MVHPTSKHVSATSTFMLCMHWRSMASEPSEGGTLPDTGSSAPAKTRHVPDYASIAGTRITARIQARAQKPPPKPLHEPVYPVYPRHVAAGVLPSAVRVHPKGFRILSKSSPLERNMGTYFRLPPQAPPQLKSEQNLLKRTVDTLVRADTKDGVVLDGFMLLEACGVKDPADATEVIVNDSNVVGVVADDLAFFTNVTFADFGENELPLSDLTPLVALEELHLQCNCLTDAASGLSVGVFPKLHTLNLSFNRLDHTQLTALGCLPVLQRLDLSCNNLRELPRALTGLRCLEQLALENNKFRGPAVLTALGTLPALREVNLNYNALSQLPKLESMHGASAQDVDPAIEHGVDTPNAVPFPRLEVLSVGANQFTYFEDVYPLIQLPALQRVILWGNPLENRSKDTEILRYEFNGRGIHVVLDSPVPRKKRGGEFYVQTRNEHVRVPAVDGRGMPRKRAQHPKSAPPAAPAAHTAQPGPDGSFFMTQNTDEPSHHHQQQQQPPPASSDTQQSRDPGGRARVGLHSAGGLSDMSVGSAGSGVHEAHASRAGRTASRGGSRIDTEALRSSELVDGAIGVTQPSSTRRGATKPSSLAPLTRPNANMRSVMTELRRMLRQPLPAVTRPRFATTGKHDVDDSDDDDDE